MLSKKEAVNLDERFIDWIANAQGSWEECQGKRFITICPLAGDSMIQMFGFDELDELGECFEEMDDEERASGPLEAIFDTEKKKELKFREEYKLIIDA